MSSNVKRYKKANTLEENHIEFKKGMQIVQWGLTYLKNNKNMPDNIRYGAHKRASIELWRLMRRLIDLERDYKKLKKEIDAEDIFFEPEDPEEYSDPDLTLTFDTDLGIWKNGNGSKVSNTHMENVEVKFRLIKRMREITEKD